ncbi:phosphate transporter family protein [Nitzschia inconspicua]|uniref:Phosphate transporter family protein n=1 Tax=Nitzschia inconspicua TaxID=303405 RepID=A0A9K3LEB6_9STRA|nr:phosphate transporter family protein [Nitzschia inconspicua]
MMYQRSRMLLLLVGVTLVGMLYSAEARSVVGVHPPIRSHLSRFAFVSQPSRRISILSREAMLKIRGGGDDVEEEDDDDSDTDDDLSEQGEEEEDQDTNEEEVDATLIASITSKKRKGSKDATTNYDEPYSMPMSMMIYSTFVPILLSRKIDLYQPVIVRTLRFLFIGLLILQQAFIFYVRVMAKSRNDRTVVHIKSPLDAAMDSKMADMAGGGGNEMLKKLASSFLSKDTTVMEYDMNQAKSMQSGIIFSMLIMGFLHFKLEQVQPLLISIINNSLQLLYNPLFQVYILGRNLERPFVTPKPEWMKQAEAMAEQQKEGAAAAEVGESKEEDVEVEVTIEEVEEEEEVDAEDEENDDETDDGGNEEGVGTDESE